MRISDWSSDVCSSDLSAPRPSAGWPTPFRLESVATPPVENQELKSPRLQGDARLCGGLPVVCQVLQIGGHGAGHAALRSRSEEHTSELQSLMRISYAVFCLKKKKPQKKQNTAMYQCIQYYIPCD